jgi:hypothetical protein
VVAADTAPFGERVARMERIRSGAEAYGRGSPMLQATSFYLDHLLADAVDRARSASRLPARRVDLLISVCGFAATPTVLAFELLQPRRLLVLRSQDASDSVNLIGRHLVPDRLDFESFQHETVDPTDPLDMYAKIKRWLAGHSGRYAVIDITGGRKVMSAAAALAAWQLNLGLTYVENQFDPQTRQPLPGMDRLITLDNPTAMFGEQEMRRALEIFRSGAFEAARVRYEEICESIAEPGRARLMRDLSALYRAWCDLDLVALPGCAAAVRRNLRLLTDATTARLDAQLAFAHRLAAGDGIAFVVCFYLLGRHYQRLGRHDFAALLFYRTIEACLTTRLRMRYPGFDPDDCDYALLGDPTAVRDRFQTLGRTLTPPSAGAPPGRLTLFAAALLLAAEDDELARDVGLPDPARLQQLRDRTRARNKSVLAHGTEPISGPHTESLREEAAELLTGFWRLHGDPVELDDLLDQLRFLRTDR